MTFDLASAMEPVALALMGEPNRALSRGKELRWGKKGSFEVNSEKGVWQDYESGDKGGTLALIKHVKGLEPAQAFEWMRSTLGIEIEGDRPRTRTNGSSRPAPKTNGAHPPREAAAPAADKPKPAKRTIAATYDYLDADGAPFYQVVRFEPKGFAQRIPAPGHPGAWIWSLHKGTFVRHERGTDWFEENAERTPDRGWGDKIIVHEDTAHGLFNFPDVREEMLQAPDDRRTIFICEGEKDCLTLAKWGLLATTNSGGAANWRDDHAAFFAGADVVVLTDNDKAGRERGEKIVSSLHAAKASVKLLDWPQWWPGAPEKADVTDWKDLTGGTKEKLFEIVGKLPAWSPVAYKSKFGAIQWSELTAKREPYEWLIRGILPAHERIMMFGEPESGKSFAATEMCLAIARGVKYADKKVKRAGVIYCAFEGGKGFATRVEGYRQHHGLETTDGTPFIMLTRGVDLFGDEEIIKELEEEIEHWAGQLSEALGLIAFDTVSASAGSMDENHGADVAKYLMMIRRIGAKFKCAVLMVHHKPKNTGDSPRGSGKWTGDLETTIEVSYEKHGAEDENGRPIRVVQLRKQREGEGQREIKRFVLRQIEVGVDAEGHAIPTCVVLPPGGAVAGTKKTGFSPTPQEEKVFRAFLSALKKFGQPPPLTAEIPAGVAAVVTYRQWRDEFAAMEFNQEEDSTKANNRIKTAMARAGYTFTEKFGKVIGRLRRGGADDLFWLTGVAVRGFAETYSKPKLVEDKPVADAPAEEEF